MNGVVALLQKLSIRQWKRKPVPRAKPLQDLQLAATGQGMATDIHGGALTNQTAQSYSRRAPVSVGYPSLRSRAPKAPSIPCRYGSAWRSEEHTSELQSRGHPVCRLLLEKKEKPPNSNGT